MIARGGKRLGQFAEDAFAVVLDFAGLAVKQLGCANDFPAERRADGLMSQANSENRKFASELLNKFDGDACVLRSAGPR